MRRRRRPASNSRWKTSGTDDRVNVAALRAHESDGDHACATKLLWTRVQGGVTKALAGTTLAELVEFADAHTAPVREPLAGSAA